MSSEATVHVNRKLYGLIFVYLLVLTVLEWGVAVYWPAAWGNGSLVASLVVMALVKAGLVGFYFMHLGHETNVLKATVAVPLSLPLFYAAVLVAEAAWRFLHASSATP